jgi:hypothetical protein
VADAAKAVLAAGGDAVAVAEAVATAAEYGGAGAAKAAAQAAIDALKYPVQSPAKAAVVAAQTVANIARALSQAGFSIAEVAEVVKAVAAQVAVGGVGAAQAASNAVQNWLDAISRGAARHSVGELVATATDAGAAVRDAVQAIRNAGGTAGEIAAVTRAVIEAASFGAPVAQAVARAARAAASFGGLDAAASVVKAAQAVLSAVKAVAGHGGTYSDGLAVANIVAHSAELCGADAAQAAADAATNAIAFGDGAREAVGAAQRVVDVLSHPKISVLSFSEQLDVVRLVAKAADGGAAAAGDAANAFANAMDSGDTASEVIGIVQDVADAAFDYGAEVAHAVFNVADHGGVEAADAISHLLAEAQGLPGSSHQDLLNIANTIAHAAEWRGGDAAVAISDVAFDVVEKFGDIRPGQLTDVVHSLSDAYSSGGQEAFNLAGTVVDHVDDIGGNAKELAEALRIVAEQTQLHRGGGGNAQVGDIIVNSSGSGQTAAEFLANLRNGGATGSTGDTLLARPSVGQIAIPIPVTYYPVTLTYGAYDKLQKDLSSGADKSTIQKDAQDLAAIAGKVHASTLQKVALLVGSGYYTDDPSSWLKQARTVTEDNAALNYNVAMDPLGGADGGLNAAYLQLEVDISNNADTATIKADADNVKNLAGSDHPGLADAANNIINSIGDGSGGGSYNGPASLTALMNNPPNAPAAAPPPPTSSPPPPSQPQDEGQAYQKLLDDLANGGDITSIAADADQLAGLAIRNGDDHLAQVALDIGDELLGTNLDIPALDGITDYGPSAVDALKNAAPGPPAAKGDV